MAEIGDAVAGAPEVDVACAVGGVEVGALGAGDLKGFLGEGRVEVGVGEGLGRDHSITVPMPARAS